MMMNDEKIDKLKTQRLAAAASVAVGLALKLEKERLQAYPLPAQATISAWQAVLRSNIHSIRGNTR